MYSLRFISLFAIACATLSYAAPLSGLPGLPALPAGLPAGLPGVPGVPVLPVPRGAVAKSFPDIIFTATHSIKPIVGKLLVDINVVSVDQVDHTVLVGHLNEIVVVLQIAITDVKLVVKSASYLSHKGKVLSVDEVAHAVFHLLDLIFGILYSVVKLVGITDASVGTVVVIIGTHLLELLTISLSLVAGLQVALAVIVKPVATTVTFLNYSSILSLLKISL